jgi:PAS domain S-box-containing protein
MQPSGFDDKLLARLGKLDPDQVQNYLARLLAQKQFLQTIFDHLDEGIIVTDGDLSIFFINRRARSMLGWPRDRSFVGEDLSERLAQDHPLHDIITSLRGRLRAIEGYEVAWGPRDRRTLSISTLPMRAQTGAEPEDEGEENLLIVLLHDVTERYRRQSEQARARRLTSLATLTSGIAHEIKNPLNSLNIHAQLLRAEVREAASQSRPPDLAKTTRATEVIIEESARLKHIVEQFIQAARPGAARFVTGDLRPLVDDLERIFRPE